jgi:hypothetical protein
MAAIPYLLLSLASAYYCHRLYGVYLPFDQDVAQNLYFAYHRDLLAADHNPFQWYYASYLPTAHNYNPFLVLPPVIFSQFAFGLSRTAQALVTNIFASFACLTLLTWTTYALFRYVGRRVGGSFIGALVVGFTGFHVMAGVRLFDQFYLLSFAMLGPTLIAFDKIAKGFRPLPWMALAAMAIGLSLLGGTNVPLFLYVPFLLLLPWCAPGLSLNHRVVRTLCLLLSVGLGVLASAAVLVPGIIFLKDTNRAQLLFHQAIFNTTFREKVLTLFFHDWWTHRFIPSAATEYYVGLPILALVALGLWQTAVDWKKLRTEQALTTCLLVCLGVGLIVMNYEWWPAPVGRLIERFYALFSIRYPHRFYQLCALPLGYLAAKGFDSTNRRRRWAVLILFLGAYLFLARRYVGPEWSQLIADHQWAALASQAMALSAVGMLLLETLIRKWRVHRAAAPLCALAVFAMYAFVPLQLTSFPSDVYRQPKPTQTLGLYLPERYGWSEWLGLSTHYGESVDRVETLLTQVPPDLKPAPTRLGKVFEDLAPHLKSGSYFAPVSGHRFAFTNVDDPSTPSRIRDLSMIRTEAILDLMGVCWVRNRSNNHYEARPTCLPEIYLADEAKRFSEEASLVAWMQSATRNDFKHAVAINCGERKCTGVPRKAYPKGSDQLEIKDVTPGNFSLRVTLAEPRILFLSTPYRFDWKARVNGREVPVYRGNHAFLAVPLNERGEQNVEISLEPYVTRWAWIGSLVMYVMLAGLWLVERETVVTAPKVG